MPLSAVENVFGGARLDRASERRADAEWIAARRRDPAARAVVLRQGRLLAEGAPLRLAWRSVPLDAAPERLLFLGLDGERPLWALDDPGPGGVDSDEAFAELRGLAALLLPAEAGIAAAAKSLFDWHARHRFCANCGQASEAVDAGWKRVCPACAAQHFPRTDPVVIMLALHGGRCLLGRQPAWPAGRFSALAGFMEPGETIEAACVRELKEEAGLETAAVRYHSSQPWPWPSQLMIGLFAELASDQARPDGAEIEELRWFSRTEARALLAGRLEGVSAPPPMAIAHQLLRAWAEGSSAARHPGTSGP